MDKETGSSLNVIEERVIKEFLLYKGAFVKDLANLFKDLKISSRELTQVGFITDLKKSKNLKIERDTKSYKWGTLGAYLNKSIDTGYLLYG